MPYAAAADVAALIKNLDSYGDVDAVEIRRILNSAESEINSLLNDYYRAPLTINLSAAEFVTSASAATVGAVTLTVAATSTLTSPQDGYPRAIAPGNAIYIDPGTSVQERAVVRSIAGLVLTLEYPSGRAPVTQNGLLYAHGANAVVVLSSSLDALFTATTHLAMAILAETYLAAVDESGKDGLPNRWRMVAVGQPATKNMPAIPGIMAEVASGARQFQDAIASPNRPLFPPGAALGTELAWDGQTPGAVGSPVFYKEESVIFDQDNYS